MTESEFWSHRFNEYQRQELAYYQDIGWQALRPSTCYKPTLSIDGNQWCAMFGPNLMEGVAGFGDSPAEAFEDFDRNWIMRLPKQDIEVIKCTKPGHGDVPQKDCRFCIETQTDTEE